MLGINGKEKPEYKEDDFVSFSMGSLNGRGRIRGLAFEHIIDMWIVEIVDIQGLPETYKWSCLVVPHTALERIVESHVRI